MRYIELMEAGPVEDQASYYMTEGCGIFAYALWIAHGKPSHGMIGIISSADGEPWSRSIPFEVTHAYFILNDKDIDVRGVRSVEDMVEELYLGAGYNDEGPYPPEFFRRRFMGASDRFPLFGSRAAIQEALKLIQAHPAFYALAEAKPSEQSPG